MTAPAVVGAFSVVRRVVPVTAVSADLVTGDHSERFNRCFGDPGRLEIDRKVEPGIASVPTSSDVRLPTHLF